METDRTWSGWLHPVTQGADKDAEFLRFSRSITPTRELRRSKTSRSSGRDDQLIKYQSDTFKYFPGLSHGSLCTLSINYGLAQLVHILIFSAA